MQFDSLANDCVKMAVTFTSSTVVNVQFLKISLPNDIPLPAVHCIGELESNCSHYSFLSVCLSSQQQDNFFVVLLTSLLQLKTFSSASLKQMCKGAHHLLSRDIDGFFA